MSKGIPVIGRDPNGKAKIVNVDEHGNLKVAQSGNIAGVITTYEQTFDELSYDNAYRMVFGQTQTYRGDGIAFANKAIDISKHRDIVIHIHNDTNVALNTLLVALLPVAEPLGQSSAVVNHYKFKNFEALPARARITIDSGDMPGLEKPYLSMKIYSILEDAPTEGKINLIVTGELK